jgi:hypothetical protein
MLLLMEENERPQKHVSQLVHENAYMKQQLQNVQNVSFILLVARHVWNQFC